MKKLIPAILLLAIGIALPASASAKVDAATLDKQRSANKIRLEKVLRHRAGRNNTEAAGKELRSLKLDAIAPSPRRGAKKYYGKLSQDL